MGQAKFKTGWHRLGLAVILLMTGLFLVVGTAWARYQTNMDPESIHYVPKSPSSVYLLKSITETGAGTSFNTFENTWVTSGGESTLDFYISNSEDGTVPDESQRVTIRLIASSGVKITANTVLQLYLPAKGEIWQGTVQPIAEETPLYTTFGPGWVFLFRDDDGKELNWTLEGGALSCFPAQLILQDAEIQEDSILQLQVSGEMFAD